MEFGKELSGIKKNVCLKKYTTFRIGGRAKYFFEAKKKEDLLKAIEAAKKLNLTFFILGGGSNLLVSDRGFNGLVIKCQMSNLKCQNQNSNVKTIYVESGVKLGNLVNLAFKNSLTGLEWAVGIPGTVGGAIFGNAGAFEKSIKDVVKEVEALRITNYEIRITKFLNRDCQFGYRESIFKKKKNLIILSALFELKRGKRAEIKRKIKEFLNYRKKSQPLDFPSAGSIFKNYELRTRNYELLKKFPELKEFIKKKQIPAGWLIEKCGLKGKKIGGAKISEKNGNFILNFKNAKAKDVLKLIKLIKKSVKKKFKIDLEEEIQYLGF